MFNEKTVIAPEVRNDAKNIKQIYSNQFLNEGAINRNILIG